MLETSRTIELCWKSPTGWLFAKTTPRTGARFKAYDRGAQKPAWQALAQIASRVAKNFNLFSMTEADRFQECLCAILVNLEKIYEAKSPSGFAYTVCHRRMCKLYRADKKLTLIPVSQMGDKQFADLPQDLALEAIMPKNGAAARLITADSLAYAVEHLHWAMRHLTDNELRVIEMSYGFNEDETELTYEEIGKRLKLSTSRIGQIEQSAIKRLRRLFERTH